MKWFERLGTNSRNFKTPVAQRLHSLCMSISGRTKFVVIDWVFCSLSESTLQIVVFFYNLLSWEDIYAAKSDPEIHIQIIIGLKSSGKGKL